RNGFTDLYPEVALRWNSGVNNWMIYGMGDIPVGTYDHTRLANFSIGHGCDGRRRRLHLLRSESRPRILALKAASLERRIELVGEVRVVAAVGDEDAKLPFVGRGRLFYLLGNTSRLRRSWTGCVMRDVCHSTAPMRCSLATNIDVGK